MPRRDLASLRQTSRDQLLPHRPGASMEHRIEAPSLSIDSAYIPHSPANNWLEIVRWGVEFRRNHNRMGWRRNAAKYSLHYPAVLAKCALSVTLFFRRRIRCVYPTTQSQKPPVSQLLFGILRREDDSRNLRVLRIAIQHDDVYQCGQKRSDRYGEDDRVAAEQDPDARHGDEHDER